MIVLNGSTGIDTPTIDGTAEHVTSVTGFKNRIINGSFKVWQYGTSFSAPAGLTYIVDRWYSTWGAANRTLSQQAGFSGSQYCLRVARNAGTTDATYTGVQQIIETNNLLDLQGTTVTVSFSARCGANFSAASNALAVSVQTGSGADQGRSAAWGATWTNNAYPYNSSVTLTTTAQTFSYQVAIPSNCQEIALSFAFLSSGTAGAADYFEITGVQLEKGSTATSFDYRPYGTELALCQRYYQTTFYHNTSWNSANADGTLSLPVQMRTTPSIVFSDSAGTLNKYTDSAGNGLTYAINANSAGSSYFVSQAILGRAAGWYQFNLYLTAEL